MESMNRCENCHVADVKDDFKGWTQELILGHWRVLCPKCTACELQIDDHCGVCGCGGCE